MIACTAAAPAAAAPTAAGARAAGGRPAAFAAARPQAVRSAAQLRRGQRLRVAAAATEAETKFPGWEVSECCSRSAAGGVGSRPARLWQGPATWR